MTVGTYAPRVFVHPDRCGATKSGVNRLLVLHTSEGAELPSSAEALGSFMGQPGDRPNTSGGRYGSSYHCITDTERLIPAVPNDVVAYSAAGANHDGVHLCIPGKAGQTREQWLDTNSRAFIRQAAMWLVDQSRAENIPLVRRNAAQVKAGAAGVCDHDAVSKAFGQSSHWDVGPNFPWDVLWNDVNAYLASPLLPGGSDMFQPIQPTRASDTRAWPGVPLDANKDYTFGLANVIPSNAVAVAVALNVAVVAPATAGFVTVWPSGARPNTSMLNFDKNETANGSIVVGAVSGGFRIATSTRAHVIVDVTGYWTR